MSKSTTRTALTVAAAALSLTVATAASADGHMSMDHHEEISMVGGAEMYPAKNIVENAVNSPIHTTLVAAVQAAGLVDTLASPGPFTVFAPTNDAFAKLPAGTVDTLLMPENKDKLTAVLTYHVVPGRVSAAELIGMIEQGGGMAKLTTVQGGTLTARVVGGKVVLTDAAGGTATVTQADVFQSNGVIHVTDSVSLPG